MSWDLPGGVRPSLECDARSLGTGESTTGLLFGDNRVFLWGVEPGGAARGN